VFLEILDKISGIKRLKKKIISLFLLVCLVLFLIIIFSLYLKILYLRSCVKKQEALILKASNVIVSKVIPRKPRIIKKILGERIIKKPIELLDERIKKIIEITTQKDEKITVVETKEGVLLASSETAKEIVVEQYEEENKIKINFTFRPKIGATYLGSRLEPYVGLDFLMLRKDIFLEAGFTTKSLHFGFSRAILKYLFLSLGYAYKVKEKESYIYISVGVSIKED
jgi:hypothetical protein